MPNETDIIAANNDNDAELLDLMMEASLYSHPCPHATDINQTPDNCPDCIAEQIDDEIATREGREFDLYEKAQLDRLDSIRDGDFDERPFWN